MCLFRRRICITVWERLDFANGDDLVTSVEKVADELEIVDDDLATWVKERRSTFFLSPDVEVASALDRVSDWTLSSGYESSAVTMFLQVADYWLIAHALAHNCIVVTHEIPADTVRKTKIPNACLALGLACLTPYEMLRRERVRFVLA